MMQLARQINFTQRSLLTSSKFMRPATKIISVCIGLPMAAAAAAPAHDETTFLGFPADQHLKEHHPRSTEPSAGSATLSAMQLKFADKGGDINVTWSGVDTPDQWDWIAVYCGRETAPSAENILDWTYVPYVAQSGAVTFKNMVNMRCNYYFRYYRDLPGGEYEELAESNEVEPAGGFNVPMHGRLSLTDVSTEMQVTWTSGSQQQGAQFVRYDTNCTDVYDVVADGSTHQWAFVASNTTAPATYAAADMCGRPATEIAQKYYRHPGYFHTITLQGLEESRIYCYQYGNDIDGYSDVSYFKTSPGVGAEKGISFIAYGDMGVGAGYDGKSTALRVTAEISHLDMLLHFGDISYARGLGYIWEQWHYLIEPISTRIPYLVSIGNHEYDHTTGGLNDPSGAEGTGFHPDWGNYGNDSHGECSVPMYHRFYTPQNGNDLYWYSFKFGNVHVVQMSSEHDYTVGSEQYHWLEQNLKNVDRSQTPFVVRTVFVSFL